MNPTPDEVAEVRRLLVLQVAAATLLTHAFLLLPAVMVAVAVGWRRLALLLIAAVGGIVFWIPSRVTLIVGPVLFFGGLAAVVGLGAWRRLAGERSRRR